MKITRGILAAGLAAMLAPATANAQNWYMGAQMGLNLARDADMVTGGVNTQETYDPGFAILGQVGAPVGLFRLEGEVGWRRNTVDERGSVGAAGTANVFNFMANAYYDVPVNFVVTPYIGAGIGGALVGFDNAVIDDTDTAFAYQGIAGLQYRINESLSLKADYRYFATTDLSVHNRAGAVVDAEYSSHDVMIGFTYRFGAPAPAKVVEQVRQPAPPPPPPAPPPAPQNFMVFFDFDKDVLTPEAQSVLRKAADYIKAGQFARVSLTGHADRSGTDAYNVKLSQRRGDNVKKFLAGLGVRADAISVVARGESAPLVPTQDGVREPQNRRVEIVLP